MRKVIFKQSERPLRVTEEKHLETEVCDYCKEPIITKGKNAENYVCRRQGWHDRKYWHNTPVQGKDCWYRAGREQHSQCEDRYSQKWHCQMGMAKPLLLLWIAVSLVWGFLGGEIYKKPPKFTPTKIERKNKIVKTAEQPELTEEQQAQLMMLLLLMLLSGEEGVIVIDPAPEPVIEDGPNTEGVRI